MKQKVDNKTPVVGPVERGGRVQAQATKNASASMLQDIKGVNRMKKDVVKRDGKTIGMKIPRAQFAGTLQVGDSSLPCYVLEGGKRVFSTRGMLESLGYKANANPQGVFHASAIQPYMLAGGDPYDGEQVVEFITDRGSRAHGFDVEKFMDICHVYSQALEGGGLTGRNLEAAMKANAIIRACSKIGIIALVDEATGYQYARAEDALQFKLKLYLAEEMRAWEKTFPDDLWIEFARLTQWDGQPTKNRPRYCKYIKENKPKPQKGQNYHQWFNADIGMKRLIEHINRVIGMAQGCDTMHELKLKMHRRYGRGPIQLELFMEKNDNAPEAATKINMPFDEAMKRIANVPASKK